MEEKVLHFRYKGKRDYVHGTDMHEEFASLIRAANPEAYWGTFKMVIHEVTRDQCRLIYQKDAESILKPENGRVEFSFLSDELNLSGWLVETQDPVTERYAYDEDQITQKCSVEGKNIKINEETPYLPIEVLVAMNKHLHLSLFPEADGKWWFTRLDLMRLLEAKDAQFFRIELLQNLQHKLTKSRVFVNNEHIGYIYFSLVKA